MMNIIAASRLREVVETRVNTIVGGVASEITTAQDFASKTSLSSSDITNFKIIGDDVHMFIEVNYSIVDSAFYDFQSPILANKLTCFIDFEGRVLSIGRRSFKSSNIKLAYFPSANLPGIEIFDNCVQLKLTNIENAAPIGLDSTDDRTFENVTSQLITNIINETNNAGSPDGDIITLLNQGGFVKYKDLTNTNQTTAPTAPTISATTNIGGTYVELNVSQSTHVNTLKYALVFVDGYFQDVYDINNIFAINLQEQTSYDIKVIIADEYFNISPYSNTINVTTTTINTTALFQNAVAYYKLDELNGDAIDVVNGYNGTLFGGVTQGVSGKIGTAYIFDGTGYINIGIINYNEIQISCWFKTNDNSGNPIFLYGQGNQAQGEVLRFSLNNGVISSPVFGGVVEFGNNTFNDGNWHLLSISLPSKTSNTSEFELRVDNVLQPITLDPNINMNIDTSQPFIIGASNLKTLEFKGEIDEFLINNNRFTIQQESDNYNNGIGTTI